MLSEHNKHEVRKIISDTYHPLSVQGIGSGDTFKESYNSTEAEFVDIIMQVEEVFNVLAVDLDCLNINTVSDLYEHLDKLID